MKSFLKYIFEILLITFIVGFLIQFFSDYGLKNLKNSNYNDWENIVEGKINSEIIINGSSRGNVGYNPLIFEEILHLTCFNISYNAGGYNLQKNKFNIYLKNNKRPKIIIQNIDLAYFIKNVQLAEESQFIPFLNNYDISSFIEQYDTKYYYLKYIPLLKYNQNLSLLKNGFRANFSNSVDKNAKTYNGFCPQNRDFKIDYYNLKKKDLNSTADNLKKIKLLKEMIDYYLKLDKEIKLVLVWAPEHKLRMNSKFEQKRKIIIDEIFRIQKSHNNLLFVDLSHDEISNSDKYYYDTFHLNALGANIFSKKAALEIKNFLN